MTGTISSLADTSSDFYRGRAHIPFIRHNLGMNDELWRARLIEALEQSGKSKRAVSLASGNGAGYVHSILTEGKDPTIDKLLAVCDAIPVSPVFIIHGVQVRPQDEEILRALHGSPEKRAGILAILGSE